MSKFITAKIVLDSISDSNGQRLTTFELEYHRYIHSEFLTHRVFSRSSSSSRAVPVEKFLQKVRDNPVIPIEFGRNQKGMQAGEPLEGEELKIAENVWHMAAIDAARNAQDLHNLGVHKQVVNRLIEPFLTIKTLLTATDFYNWFQLRNHPDAQPEINNLAHKMLVELTNHDPAIISDGDWHMPYVTNEEKGNYSVQDLKLVSAARCARVSYLNHSGEVSKFKEDWDLCQRLAGSNPIHASPFEHVATPQTVPSSNTRNFTGWVQMREELERQGLPK